MAKDNHPAANGFLGGCVDVYFDPQLVEPVVPLDLKSIINTAFQSLGFLSGQIAQNRLEELGGITLDRGLADGAFIRYLTIPFRAKTAGIPRFELGYSDVGLVLASPVGVLPEQDIDLGTPFPVTIQSTNTAPVLAPIADRVIDELKPFEIQLRAIDNDFPTNTLTFELVGGPDGLALAPNGVLSWTPSEAQGPSANNVVVKVTDNGVPKLSATNSFKIIVREANSSPMLSPVPDQVIKDTQLLSLALQAEDDDLPTNQLTFALVSGPYGMTLDTQGNLRWLPGPGHASGTNVVTVSVADDGVPSLKGTGSFNVIVRGVPRLAAPRKSQGGIEMSWSSTDPCLLQTTDDLRNPVWKDIPETATLRSYRILQTKPQAYFRLLVRDVPLLNAPRVSGTYIELSWTSSKDCVLQWAATPQNSSWISLPDSVGLRAMRIPITGIQACFRLQQISQ